MKSILSAARHYTAENEDDGKQKAAQNSFKSKDVFTNRAMDSNHIKALPSLLRIFVVPFLAKN